MEDQDKPKEIGQIVVVLERDDSAWCAHLSDFVNVQESPCGFGATPSEAVGFLMNDLSESGIDPESFVTGAPARTVQHISQSEMDRPGCARELLFKLMLTAGRAGDLQTQRQCLCNIMDYDQDKDAEAMRGQIDRLTGTIAELKMDLDTARRATTNIKGLYERLTEMVQEMVDEADGIDFSNVMNSWIDDLRLELRTRKDTDTALFPSTVCPANCTPVRVKVLDQYENVVEAVRTAVENCPVEDTILNPICSAVVILDGILAEKPKQ